MTLLRYFAVVASVLERHWAVAQHPTDYEEFPGLQGRVASQVALLDGSYLDFSEFLVQGGSRVERLRYRYQYIREGERLFRYDDFPGHPGIAAPHHHYHAPDGQVLPVATPPNLLAVLEQAARHLFPA